MTHITSRTVASIAAGVLMVASATLANAGEITVYTAMEEEEINLFVQKAAEELPDIKLNILRLSTGNLAARLVAEADNPQADVLLSLPSTSIMNPNILKVFEPYAPKGIEQVPAKFRDAEGRWFALTGWMETFCVNTDRIAKLGLPVPNTWEELADPKYKGEVVMPDPAVSGTGFLGIATLVTILGEEKGWDLASRLSENMAQFTTSGSRPCRMAQTGEYSIGVSYEGPAIQAITEGYPVKMVIPTDAAGYEISGIGLLKGSKNEADAKAFLDWLLTDNALELYQSFRPFSTAPRKVPAEAAEKAGMPADLTSILADMDFTRIAAEREQIVAHWSKMTGR